jgi:hypothetical protein
MVVAVAYRASIVVVSTVGNLNAVNIPSAVSPLAARRRARSAGSEMVAEIDPLRPLGNATFSETRSDVCWIARVTGCEGEAVAFDDVFGQAAVVASDLDETRDRVRPRFGQIQVILRRPARLTHPPRDNADAAVAFHCHLWLVRRAYARPDGFAGNLAALAGRGVSQGEVYRR